MGEHCWLDGELVEHGSEIETRAAEALASGRACYSTAWFRGATVWAKRHAARLQRDARALGLGQVDESPALRAFEELGRHRFGSGEGIVRVTLLRENGALRILGEARDIGHDPDTWRARIAPFPHQIETAWTGAKGSNLALYERARELMVRDGLDEMLLIDTEGFVVEGCRSNVFVVDAGGDLVAPNLSRGAVAGLAQEIVHEHVTEVVIRDMPAEELGTAKEIVFVNSVRHARPLVELAGKPVADGRPGPESRRLHALLASVA